MRRCGTTSRPRVADIVAAAGLSNDAFYRHFPSKDALVAALLEDGTARLTSYLTHQMDKEADPADRVRRWVEGVLSQADEDIAATTLAVLWNGGSLGPEPQSGSGSGSGSVRTGAGAALAALAARTVHRSRERRSGARRVAGRPRHARAADGPPVAAGPTDPGRDRPHRRLLDRGRHRSGRRLSRTLYSVAREHPGARRSALQLQGHLQG